jgi:hypothetical protein
MAAKHTFNHGPRNTKGGERALASPIPERAWQDDRAWFVPEHAPDRIGRQLQFLSKPFDREGFSWSGSISA